jgi:Spy/CpxP family protein refolding chaperone
MTGGTMQKMNGMIVMMLVVAASTLAAQHKSPADTGRAAMMQRMEDRVKKELGLTDDQAAKLHATHERFEPQRRRIMERQRALHEALRGQLRPGVAANADSVNKLLDARQQNRAALMQLGRDADRELAGYLTPVQRARLEMMREHMHMMMAHGRMHGPGPGMRGHRWGPPGGDMHPGGEMHHGGDEMHPGGGAGDEGEGEDGDE